MFRFDETYSYIIAMIVAVLFVIVFRTLMRHGSARKRERHTMRAQHDTFLDLNVLREELMREHRYAEMLQTRRKAAASARKAQPHDAVAAGRR